MKIHNNTADEIVISPGEAIAVKVTVSVRKHCGKIMELQITESP